MFGGDSSKLDQSRQYAQQRAYQLSRMLDDASIADPDFDRELMTSILVITPSTGDAVVDFAKACEDVEAIRRFRKGDTGHGR